MVIPFPGFLFELAALVAPVATPILIRQAIRQRDRRRATIAAALASVGVLLACLPPSWSLLGYVPLAFGAFRVRRELPGLGERALTWERVTTGAGVALVLCAVSQILFFLVMFGGAR